MNSVFGLGIVLSLQDQFSRQAHLLNGSFAGLLNNAQQLCAQFEMLDLQMKAFTQLATMGMGLNTIGHEFLNFSNAIYQGMESITKKIVSTGSDFEIYRNTLSALFKDKNIGKIKADWAAAFAARTPFEINEVTQALIGYKAAGVDATNMMAGIDGKMRPFLQYVGDLAALRPDVGMKGVLFAVREMMNGQLVSMRRRLDIDPEQILGRSIGTTVEQRIKDVVELSQKLAPNLMESLNGTWMQVLSNMKDNLTRFFLGIADGGAFDAAKKTMMRFSDLLNDILNNPARLKTITTNLASVFNVLWKPVDLLANAFSKIINVFATITEKYPWVVKLFGVVTEALMIILGATGGILVFVGNFLIIFGALGMMFVTFKGFFLTLKTIFQVLIKLAGTAGAGALTAGFSTFASVIGIAILVVAQLIAVGAALYYAYKYNFAGFKDLIDTVIYRLKYFHQNIVTIINAFKSGNLTEIMANHLVPSKFNGFIKFLLAVKSFISGVKLGFSSMWAELKPKLMEFMNAFKKITLGWGGNGGFFDALMKGDLLNAMSKAMDAGILLGKYLAAVLTVLIGEVFIIMRFVEAFIVVIAKIVRAVVSAVSWFFSLVLSIYNGIKSLVDLTIFSFLSIKRNASVIWDSFFSTISSTFGKAKKVVNDFVSTFKQLFSDVLTIIKKIGDFFNKTKTLHFDVKGIIPSGLGLPKFAKAATGGDINGEGLMYVHQNEFVANSDITRKLKDWDGGKTSISSSDVKSDNSTYKVEFTSGSIVINGDVTRDVATKMADEISNQVIRKIKRDKQIENILKRKPVLSA